MHMLLLWFRMADSHQNFILQAAPQAMKSQAVNTKLKPLDHWKAPSFLGHLTDVMLAEMSPKGVLERPSPSSHD